MESKSQEPSLHSSSLTSTEPQVNPTKLEPNPEWISMGEGKDYPPPVPDKSLYLVGFDGPEDPLHPTNHPLAKKFLYGGLLAVLTLSVSLGSSIFAEAGAEISAIYHVGSTVSALGTAVFVFGFAAGPVVWGPLSELFGRKIVAVSSGTVYSCFCFACATSTNIQSIIITRFFQGLFGSALLVTVPAVLADMFDARSRGKAVLVFSSVLFGGPFLGPIIAGFTIKNPNLGWRWTQYFPGIISAVTIALIIPFFRDTHPPTVLKTRAQKLREQTGIWAIRAPIEDASLDVKSIINNYISRPLVLLVQEPVVALMSFYSMFVYGLVYMCLTIIPIIFQGEYRFSEGVAELPYLALMVGLFLGIGVSVLCDNRFIAVMDKNGGKPVPEERLLSQMIGAILFPIGLFWLGWAGNYADKVHWIVPTLGCVPLGAGIITIFLPCFTYLIDCYLIYAASALLAMAFVRSAFAGAAPLFTKQMFDAMGIQWASTLLGLVSVVLVPIPFLFYKYGHQLRKKSSRAFA